jgi:hypothetical protein
MTDDVISLASRGRTHKLVEADALISAGYAKSDALLHAACDVIAELHYWWMPDGKSEINEEDIVLQILLYVFVERCMRRGLNPGEELENWFAIMDLPPIAKWKKWRQEMTDIVTPDFLRECDERRADVWRQTKAAAFGALLRVLESD